MRRLLATVLLVLTARDLAVEHWLKSESGRPMMRPRPIRRVWSLPRKFGRGSRPNAKEQVSRKDAVQRYRLDHSIGKARKPDRCAIETTGEKEHHL